MFRIRLVWSTVLRRMKQQRLLTLYGRSCTWICKDGMRGVESGIMLEGTKKQLERDPQLEKEQSACHDVSSAGDTFVPLCQP